MSKKIIYIIAFIFCSIIANATDRALLIGIGDYPTTSGWEPIHGDDDINKLLAPNLKEKGFIVTTLINEKATRKGILNALDQLINSCKANDRVFIHFSTHGQPFEDFNKDERPHLYDQSIAPYDAHNSYKKGIYEGTKHIIDDELSHYFQRLKNKLGNKGMLFVSIDVCNSDGMARNEDINSLLCDSVGIERGSEYAFKFYGNPPKIKTIYPASLKGGAPMTIVCACHKNEKNFEYNIGQGKIYGTLSFQMSKLITDRIDFNYWATFFEKKKYNPKYFDYRNIHPSIIRY